MMDGRFTILWSAGDNSRLLTMSWFDSGSDMAQMGSIPFLAISLATGPISSQWMSRHSRIKLDIATPSFSIRYSFDSEGY